MTSLEEWMVKLQVISTALQLGLIDQIKAGELLESLIRQIDLSRKGNMWP